MDQYRPTIEIKPIDPYEKAKHELITALRSFSMLSPTQQVMLAKELFGVAYVDAVVNLMQRRY